MSVYPPLHRTQGGLEKIMLLIVLAVGLAGCAQMSTDDQAQVATPTESAAQVPPPSDAERLTALVLRAMPMEAMLESSLDKDRNWPVGGRAASKIDPARLQCLRQRLSPAGYQASRKEAVDTFIQRYPDQVQDAIAVLEQGGADVMGATFQAGLQAGRTGGAPQSQNAAGSLTPAQLSQFTNLSQDDKYQPLRQLLMGNSRFPSDKRAGADAGKTIGLRLIRDALNHCNVPMSVFR
jgi:hypothetical protein